MEDNTNAPETKKTPSLRDLVDHASSSMKKLAAEAREELVKKDFVVPEDKDQAFDAGFILGDALNGVAKRHLIDLIDRLADTSRTMRQKETDRAEAKIFTNLAEANKVKA